MKRIVTTSGLVAAAFALTGIGGAWAAADPSGTWLTQDGRARVRVEKCASNRQLVCGYVVWLKPGTAKSNVDRYNPDTSKQSRPVIGHQMLLGLRPDSDGHYNGQVYNADDGKSYDVEVWLDSPGALKVKGCLIAFLCSTQNWTPAGEPVAGQLLAATGQPGGPTPDPEYAGKGGPAAAPRRDAKPKT